MSFEQDPAEVFVLYLKHDSDVVTEMEPVQLF